jgi:hypothetical protein
VCAVLAQARRRSSPAWWFESRRRQRTKEIAGGESLNAPASTRQRDPCLGRLDRAKVPTVAASAACVTARAEALDQSA